MGAMMAMVLLLAAVVAEVGPLSENELRREADLVVVGSVRTIKTQVIGGEPVRVSYLVEVAVRSVEQGTLATNSGLVGARGWCVREVPDGWAGPCGHYYMSENGDNHYISELKREDKVRMYLKRRATDGTRELVYPNGFVVLR